MMQQHCFSWPASGFYVHIVITSGFATPITSRETSPYSGRSFPSLSETLANLWGPAAALTGKCCDDRNDERLNKKPKAHEERTQRITALWKQKSWNTQSFHNTSVISSIKYNKYRKHLQSGCHGNTLNCSCLSEQKNKWRSVFRLLHRILLHLHHWSVILANLGTLYKQIQKSAVFI